VPKPICDAGILAIESGKRFTRRRLGIPELLLGDLRYYRGPLTASRCPASAIIITSGASGALLWRIGFADRFLRRSADWLDPWLPVHPQFRAA